MTLRVNQSVMEKKCHRKKRDRKKGRCHRDEEEKSSKHKIDNRKEETVLLKGVRGGGMGGA